MKWVWSVAQVTKTEDAVDVYFHGNDIVYLSPNSEQGVWIVTWCNLWWCVSCDTIFYDHLDALGKGLFNW